ncbi:hypothetical protein [Nostoc sp.]|uniref:hypothetical protein n=1 Tax=Nostoc sp. TaxID=1180 RepID=UPI002FF69255
METNVKAEVTSGCAEHGNVAAEVTCKTTEVASGCAKYGNVTAKVTSRTTEVASGCVKHGNVAAEVTCKTTEVISGCTECKSLLLARVFRDLNTQIPDFLKKSGI